MTSLQEDLTDAFERRANAASVEDNLDAILSGTNLHRVSSHNGSSRHGGTLLAVAASAAVLVGAAGLLWATTARTDTPASSSAPMAPASDTDSTVPLRDLNWESAVAEVLKEAGWELAATEYILNDGEPFGASVVALVGDGRVEFEVQAYADGEFSDDPDWQMGVAGSTTPGTRFAEGTLFVTDEETTSVRRAVVVSPLAIVTVHAESVPVDRLPDIDTFTTAAIQLAARVPNVLAAAGN